MTKAEILALEGDALNEAVDRYVFKRERKTTCDTYNAGNCNGVWRTRCGACGYSGLGSVRIEDSDSNWYCRIATDEGTPSYWREVAEVESTLPAISICKAALMAVMKGEE